MKLSRPVTSVIFDLDGVLLDTEPLYTEATNAIVGQYGKTYDWELKQDAIGRDPVANAKTLLERLEIPLTVEEFHRRRKPILERLMRSARAMPGAEEFVRDLFRRNVRTAVATSSERSLKDLKTSHHPWFDCFAAFICGDDPRVSARKPAPDLFLVAATELGEEPSRCLVFEDSPAGVEAARTAGMQVIAMPDPAMDPARYRDADCVIDGLDGRYATDFGL